MHKKVWPSDVLNIFDCSVGRVIAGSAFFLGLQKENSKRMFGGAKVADSTYLSLGASWLGS